MNRSSLSAGVAAVSLLLCSCTSTSDEEDSSQAARITDADNGQLITCVPRPASGDVSCARIDEGKRVRLTVPLEPGEAAILQIAHDARLDLPIVTAEGKRLRLSQLGQEVTSGMMNIANQGTRAKSTVIEIETSARGAEALRSWQHGFRVLVTASKPGESTRCWAKRGTDGKGGIGESCNSVPSPRDALDVGVCEATPDTPTVGDEVGFCKPRYR